MSARGALHRLLCLLVLVAAIIAPRAALAAEARAVPRAIVALFDGREEERVRLSRVHTMAEMPLNHLGLVVEYWDVSKGLPDLSARDDVRGVLTWFTGDPFDDPVAYVAWALSAMDRGIRFAVLGQTGARAARDGERVPLAVLNRFLGRFGLRDDDGYSDLTYRSRPVLLDPGMVGFERALGGALPGYPLQRKVDGRVRSHLVLRRGGDPATDSHLVVTGPGGGLAVEGYVRHYDLELNRKLWIIDPFAFFRAAFDTDAVPKPDVTTISGRRLYFSHVDGDGWRNVTEVEPHAKKRMLSADVVLEHAIKPYPDLPVTVAPIVGDLDPAWKGTPEVLESARRLLAPPQVEPASHTWTHPFLWAFFKDYTPDKEAMFTGARKGGAKGGGGGLLGRLLGRKDEAIYEDSGGEGAGIGAYSIPRAFLQQPFDLHREIAGSLHYMDAIAPEGRRARLVQWSGDTTPFEEAVAEARRAGARNINGGDTRFDPEFPSYTTVSPIGVAVGAERQIYTAASNENTYTDLWTNRFFGFQNLVHTLRNTESPVRVKPFNVYYHMYSGQKLASINALGKNLEVARASEIAPVTATAYAAIAEGFYTTRLIPDGERRWRVEGRGALATLRFDRATFTAVDFARSTGVVGQRHYQGSLYVALDPAVAVPVVALKDAERADVDPPAGRPYLVQARWVFDRVMVEGDGFRARAQGFGAGSMVWRMPRSGRHAVVAARDGVELWRGEAVVGADGRLAVTIDAAAIEPLELRVARLGD